VTITAKIIADSISSQGIRITTMQLRYPRFIHAEFLTHRVFSRNASSSRAVPVSKLIEDIQRDPAMPIHWGKNQKGMQAHEEHDAPVILDPSDQDGGWQSEHAWLSAMNVAIHHAKAFEAAGYHKQIVNRILEPFSHINVLVTSTSWANFYALRQHPDAQPEIKALADAMWEAQQASTPKLLYPGEWHLPYVDQTPGMPDMEGVRDYISKHDVRVTPEVLLLRVSVARCARVSYLTHEQKVPVIETDLSLYERLVGSVPLHASPAEHQATPDRYDQRDEQLSRHAAGTDDGRHPDFSPELAWLPQWEQPELHGNFTGWIQYRKTLPGECITA